MWKVLSVCMDLAKKTSWSRISPKAFYNFTHKFLFLRTCMSDFEEGDLFRKNESQFPSHNAKETFQYNPARWNVS